MLEFVALVCAVALIVWTPIEARKVAGGWVRRRHKGTPRISARIIAGNWHCSSGSGSGSVP